MAGWPNALPRAVHRTLKQVSSPDPWFTIYEVMDGTYAICEPLHYDEAISYLLLGRDRAALIDTGMGIGDLRRVVGSTTDMPLTVINTHWHYDHIGGNIQFGEVWA